MPSTSTLADKLKRAMSRSTARSGREWTTRSLGAALGRSQSHVADLLNGKKLNPTIASVEQLATALDFPAAYLLPSTRDDLEYVIWRETPEAEYLLRLLHGLSTDRLEAIRDLLRWYRELEGLPPGHLPTDDPSEDEEPAETQPPLRNRFFLHTRPVASRDEVVSRIIDSLGSHHTKE